MRQLRMFDLGHKAITALPDELGDLVQLTDFLYLHDNKLVELPALLSGLKRLRDLTSARTYSKYFKKRIG